MDIEVTSQAGSLESSDVLITLKPSPKKELIIYVKSDVDHQYGEAIKRVIAETLGKSGVASVVCYAEDKGALDYTLIARVEAAVSRAKKREETK